MALVNTNTNTSTRDVKYHRINIIFPNGVAKNITELVNMFNIFESIFTPVTTGMMELIDTTGLLAENEMHGNEFLDISFSRPNEDEADKKYDRRFRIFKIADRHPGIAQEQRYVLHFCSEEQIFSNQLTISRSFKEGAISDYIKAICKQDLRISRFGEIESSVGLQNIIIPRMAPLDAIELLCANSYNDLNSPFLFFENRSGFNFVSLSRMFEQSPIQTLKYSTARQTESEATAAFVYSNEISKFKMGKMFDVWAATNKPTYSAQLLTLDILRQKYVKQNFNAQSFDSRNFIDNGNIPMADATNRRGKSIFEEYESNICYSITNKDQSKSAYMLSKVFRVNDTNIENTLVQRQSLLNMLKNTVIESAAVAGNPQFSAGLVVDIDMPAFTINTKVERNIDPFISGKYLITGVRHNLTKSGGIQTFLSLAKNSYSSPLNSVKNTSSDYKKVQRS